MIRYIYDENGNVITTYTYDAWGRQVSVTGSNVTLGNLNPIRYKSYFYDYDTGFYYLETRFYDPTVGRFISPDDPAYLGASGSALGWNLYSYCENEPVGKVDPDGSFGTPVQWVCAIIGGVAGYYFGDFIARNLGLAPKGKGAWIAARYWVVRSAAVVGGSALGWFASKILTNSVKTYLLNKPSLLPSVVKKAGAKAMSNVIIRDLIKATVFDAGCVVLSKMKCPISKEMYTWSLYGNGKDYSSSKLNTAVKTNTTFLQMLRSKLQSTTSDRTSGSILIKNGSWNNTDLEYSIGKYKFNYSATKICDKWQVNIEGEPNQYDFTEWRYVSEKTFSSAANDFGHLLSVYGILKSYSIYINFSVTITGA